MPDRGILAHIRAAAFILTLLPEVLWDAITRNPRPWP